MVEIVNNNGVCQCEHTLELADEKVETIINDIRYRDRIRNFLKDHGIAHRLETGEQTLSTIGKTIRGRINAEDVTNELTHEHNLFIDFCLDLWEEATQDHDVVLPEEDELWKVLSDMLHDKYIIIILPEGHEKE